MIFAIGVLFLLFFIAIGPLTGFAVGVAGVANLVLLVSPDSILVLMTDTSIGKLFIGGVLPGLLTAVGQPPAHPRA